MVTTQTPTAGSTVTLYQAAGFCAVSLYVCSVDGGDTVKVYLVPNGTIRSENHALKFNTVSNSPVNLTGISLDNGDKIDVYSTNGITNFIAMVVTS